ncbi:MAG: hypothetical protein ACR2PH_08205 [Desulfobulbia bacterium]
MPRKPTEKVVEHRFTLGNYERDQLNRFIDGMQVKNIGTGVGAITDPLEAMLSNTLGTVGGVFLVSWALKRFFDIDVPIPTDLEDVTEGWNAILGAVQLDKEGRERLDAYIETLGLEKKTSLLGQALRYSGVGGPLAGTVSIGYNILKGMANFVFTPLNNPRFNPNYSGISPDYIDPGLAGERPPSGIPPEMPEDEEEGNAIWQQATNEQIGDMWLNRQISIAQAINYLMRKNGWSYQYSANWLNDYEMQKYGN